jgi:DNA end-binding protein Ku
MRALWSGALGFGLVNIPVQIFSAVQDSDLDLNMLDKSDHSPIRFKRVNEKTGKEVPWENIVKSYDYEGKTVVLEPEDFDAASAEKTDLIEIVEFIKEEEVNSMYYETPYYLAPQKSGYKAYALLQKALLQTKRTGLCTFILRNKEHLGMIKSVGPALVLNRIRFEEEIRDVSELDLSSKSEIKPNELKMAVSLIEQLSASFDIKKYKDTYSIELMKVIKAKAKGQKLNAPAMRVTVGPQKDLMQQLQESLNTHLKKAS